MQLEVLQLHIACKKTSAELLFALLFDVSTIIIITNWVIGGGGGTNTCCDFESEVMKLDI